jgi:two-component system sensor histidine kinase PilS (NtrC family)
MPPEENFRNRIRLLMVWRIFIVTFLLGFTALIDAQGESLLPEISRNALYAIIGLNYLFALIFLALLRLIPSLVVNVYLQTVIDVLIITALVYITGGIRSVHAAFYPLVIIYSVLFLLRRGGLVTASLCSLLYGTLLYLEYFRMIEPIYAPSFFDYPFSAGYVFTRLLVYTASFYIIALLASFVVEQEQRTRSLLAERENAFNQLDILHQRIIDSIDAGILTVDDRGLIKSFNRSAELITGYSAREVIDMSLGRLFPTLFGIGAGDGMHRPAGSAPQYQECPFVSKQGKGYILRCSISPLNDQSRQRIGEILIFQDVTAIRRMEQEIEENKRLAFIGEMAAGLAHEIRNPLASITGSIQVLQRDLMLKDEDEKLMRIILRGKDQLEGFLKDFLLLARPPAGKREAVRMEGLISDALDSIRYLPDWNAGIRLKTRIGPMPTLIGSLTEIRQVVWNLVLNAVQAMPDGGELRIEAETEPLQDGRDQIVLTVADQGEGIAEDRLGKIFTPFYTTKDRGTGLGLAIVQRVVAAHGGRVDVTSRPGQGTTFHIRLPLGDGTRLD